MEHKLKSPFLEKAQSAAALVCLITPPGMAFVALAPDKIKDEITMFVFEPFLGKARVKELQMSAKTWKADIRRNRFKR